MARKLLRGGGGGSVGGGQGWNTWQVSVIILLAVIFVMLAQYIFAGGNDQSVVINDNQRINLDGGGGTGGYLSDYGTWWNGAPWSRWWSGGGGGGGWLSWPYYNNPTPRDVLLNPFAPPVKDGRYIVPPQGPLPPFNASTNIGAVDTTYRQIGILSPEKGDAKDNILILMGRPLYTNRDKWQYYTISNQHNNVKLPVVVEGKQAMDDYGVKELSSGDSVAVEGMGEKYKTTVYQNSNIAYAPW